MLCWVYVRTLVTRVAKPVFQLILLATFLYFFGLPAIDTYLKKDVIVVEKKRDTDGIPFPAITIAAISQDELDICYKLSDGSIETCIENNSPNSSDLLKGVMKGFPSFGSVPINLTKEMLTEDSTEHNSGRHYVLNLPLTVGPEDRDPVYLLLSKDIKFPYQIFLHDPKFFIFSDNPIAFPMETRFVKAKSSDSHFYRLNLIQMNELNVPSDPCNTDPDFNFWACVKESVSQKVFLCGQKSSRSYFCRLVVAPSGTPQSKKHA